MNKYSAFLTTLILSLYLQLLKDSDTSFLDNLDLYIIPVLNVDGYSYTWSNVRKCV